MSGYLQLYDGDPLERLEKLHAQSSEDYNSESYILLQSGYSTRTNGLPAVTSSSAEPPTLAPRQVQEGACALAHESPGGGGGGGGRPRGGSLSHNICFFNLREFQQAARVHGVPSCSVTAPCA